MMTDRNGVSYMPAVVLCVCYTLVLWYTVGSERGTLEATLKAMTFIMLLAFSSILTDEAPAHMHTFLARKDTYTSTSRVSRTQ